LEAESALIRFPLCQQLDSVILTSVWRPKLFFLTKMSVLTQVIEKISTLKRHSNCTDNLTFEAETQEVALLLPDLQKFKITVNIYLIDFFYMFRLATARVTQFT
jgi:hypothetical protein